MNKKSMLIIFPTLLLFITSFQNDHFTITGQWKVKGLGIKYVTYTLIDSLTHREYGKGDTAMSSSEKENLHYSGINTLIVHNGAFEFKDNGKFNIVNKEGKTTSSGTYTLSPDYTLLTIKVNKEECPLRVEIVKPTLLRLTTLKDIIVFELKKK